MYENAWVCKNIYYFIFKGMLKISWRRNEMQTCDKDRPKHTLYEFRDRKPLQAMDYDMNESPSGDS